MRRLERDRGILAVCCRAALWAALIVCCLANTTPSWPLSDSSLLKQPVLDNLLGGRSGDPAAASGDSQKVPASLNTSLQLTLGRRGTLSFSGLGSSGRGSAFQAWRPAPGRALSALPALDRQEEADASTLLPPLSRDHSSQGSSYRVSYANPRLQLSGGFADVGARFSPSSSGELSPEETEALRQALGTQALNLTAAWQLASGASLSTERKTLRNDKPGDERNGATITDTAHTLALAFGKASSFKASLTDHEERWDRGLGKPDQQRQTTALEFASKFGGGGSHDLRLALTTVATGSGGGGGSETTRQAHVGLRPTGRLGLAADYTSKTDQQGHQQDTSRLSATFQLPGEGRLVAALNTVAPDGAPRRDETSFQLNTSLGGGGSKGKLGLQQAVTHAGDSGQTTNTGFSLAGNLGSGAGATNLSLKFDESRAEAASGSWSRTTGLHLDRAFGPRWKLVADSQQKVTGTNESPTTDPRSALALTAELSPRTRLLLGLSLGSPATGGDSPARDIALEQTLGGMRLRTECHLVEEGPQATTITGYGVEIPRGKLPEWATGLRTAHEFSDAGEFLAAQQSPAGLGAPLAGSRFLVRQRRGGEDDSKDTVAFSHGLALFGRQYLQLDVQRFPEGAEGDQKGRPMDLQRRALMLGSPLPRGLTGRLWLAAEDSASDPDSHRRKLGFAIWGRLSDQDQLEASVSRDSEQWLGADRDRTTVSVLFARKVSEENKLHLKVGYSWGGDPGGDTSRDYRVSLGYDKPI